MDETGREGMTSNIEARLGARSVRWEKVVGVASVCQVLDEPASHSSDRGSPLGANCGAHADAFKWSLRLGRHTCRELNSSYLKQGFESRPTKKDYLEEHV